MMKGKTASSSPLLWFVHRNSRIMLLVLGLVWIVGNLVWHLSEPSYVDAHRKHADVMLPGVRAPSNDAAAESVPTPPPPPPPPPPLAPLAADGAVSVIFAGADKDGDGKLSLEECIATGVPATAFRSLDNDKSGFLDLREFVIWREGAGGQREGGGGRQLHVRGRPVPLHGDGGAKSRDGAVTPRTSITLMAAVVDVGLDASADADASKKTKKTKTKKKSRGGNNKISSSSRNGVAEDRGWEDEEDEPCVQVLDAGPAVLHRCRGTALTDKEQSKRVRLTTPELHCDRPVVAWDAPIEGGVRTGMSSESVAFLVPLATILPLDLVHGFRDGSSFVNGLLIDEQRVLYRLRAQANLRLHPEASVYVTMWDPFESVTHLTDFKSRNGGRGFWTVARVMYETTVIPPEWAAPLKSFDEVWAPSDWGRQLLIDNGVEAAKIFTVVEGIDAIDTYDPRGFDRTRSRRDIYSEVRHDTYVFLSVFKWEERKGWRELLHAFSNEFGCAQDDVVLYLRSKPVDAFGNKIGVAAAVEAELGKACPCIRTLPRMDGLNMQMMYAGADAFVLPTHGEGWGRPAVEAMAMALPSIVTNWSGTSQFLSNTATYPIPVPELEDSKQGPGKWAKIDVPVLQALMREVESDRDKSKQVGAAARIHVLEHYDQTVVVEQVLNRIQTACIRQQTRPRAPPKPPPPPPPVYKW